MTGTEYLCSRYVDNRRSNRSISTHFYSVVLRMSRFFSHFCRHRLACESSDGRLKVHSVQQHKTKVTLTTEKAKPVDFRSGISTRLYLHDETMQAMCTTCTRGDLHVKHNMGYAMRYIIGKRRAFQLISCMPVSFVTCTFKRISHCASRATVQLWSRF